MTEYLFEPSPFSKSGRWIRAGFHCHTIDSDGGLTPEETLSRYQDAGYACAGITDHRKVTPIQHLSSDSFVAIDSIEVGGQPDVIGVGVKTSPDPALPFCEKVSNLARQGAFTIGAHPTYSAVKSETYLSCPDLMAMEIYNGYCEEAYANGIATELWDMLLGDGIRIWGVAGDDAHLNVRKRYYSDIGCGWVEIWTRELSSSAILKALRRGSFYSTQGPRFESFNVKGSKITIRTSPVEQVRWRTRGPCGYVQYASDPDGLIESSLPDWFAPRGYVRIEITDANGLRAWSNPFFVRRNV